MTAAFAPLALLRDAAVLTTEVTEPASGRLRPALAPLLGSVEAALVGAVCPIEPAMSEIGERLGVAINGLNQVTQVFEGLSDQLHSPDVHEASRQLTEVAETLTAIAEALGLERSALDALAGMTRQVGRQAEKLHKTVAAVGVLAINARIEAAHLTADREDFSVFTVEIGRLARTSSAAVQRFAEELDRLEKLLATASANQAEFEKAYAQQLCGATRRLKESLAQVAEHRMGAAQAANGIGVRSKTLSSGVASAIQALQIGDITRQRVEHVARAVGVLKEALTDERSADFGCTTLESGQQDMVVAAVCRLQSAQLVHSVEGFSHEVGDLTGTLRELADNTGAIVRMGRGVYGSASGRQSFLTDLTKDLTAADALIAASQAARERVDAVALLAEETLTGLVAQVEAIRAVEVDMRLVGLNTALKCGRLGHEGRTLSVIAQELRGYANQTVEDAQAVMAGLCEVVATAEALRRREAEQSAARMAGLEHMVANSIATLKAVDSGLSQALVLLEGEGERVITLLGQTAAGIRVHHDLERATEDPARCMTALGETCPMPDEDADAVRDRVLALLEGHYTMASERALHDLLFGLAVPPKAPACDPPSSEPSSDTGNALDDIFF